MAFENHGRYRSLDAFLAAYSERADEKYVKGIFALITLFVLVSPLPKLLKSDFSGFPNAFDTAAELEIDETFCTAWRRTHIKRRKGISKSF